MRHIAITLLGSALLSACGPTYSDTLEQKLAGKSPDQQRAVLAQECGQEIAAGIKPEDKANAAHSTRMRSLCEEMTGKKVVIKTDGR